MNQKKKFVLHKALSILLALALFASLIQQYPVSAQEDTGQITEEQEGRPDSEEQEDKPDSEEQENSIETAPQSTVEKPQERISFQAVRNSLEGVEVTLEVDGQDRGTVNYPAGLVSDHVSSLAPYLDGKEAFQKSLLRRTEADGSVTETEVFRIGTYEGAVYYSLSEQQDTGILLNAGESIVLVCASQYEVTYNSGENGSVTGPELIWNGNGLEAVVTADKYYHIETVSWSDGSDTYPLEVTGEHSMQVSVPAESIHNDITVTAVFEKDAPYMITAGQIQQGGICLNQGQEGDDYYANGEDQPIPAVTPGEDQTFMVFSQSWTGIGNSGYYLNLMRINGENVIVPFSYEVGASAETVLSNGSTVTVTLVQKNVGLYWKEGDPYYGIRGTFLGWNKLRCLYSVTVTDVQENMAIDLNFKEGNSREMIMTGLEGINSFGASSETIDWEIHWDPSLIGNHYYYDVQENDGDTVYRAYYNSGETLATAYNIYLYTVKPGYNPNTVNFEVLYDGVRMNSEDAIMPARDGSNEPAWMLTVDEMAAALDTNFRHFDAFLESAKAAGYTHCFALNQNNAYNQVLRLKANPYEYHLVFDPDGGTFDGTGLDSDKYTIHQDGTVTERNAGGELQVYTLADGSVSVNMPLVEPEKEGCVFKGWKLYKDNGPVDETLYSVNQSFVIDENTIAHAGGDDESDENHTFTFVAQWEDVAGSPDTAAYFIGYYVQDPNGTVEAGGKTYTQYYSTTEYGTVGSSIVALNDRHPGQAYTLNERLSHVKIDRLLDESAEGYADNNRILFYYDQAVYDLTIEKDARGDSDLTKEWTVEVTLKDAGGKTLTGGIAYGEVTFTNGTGSFTLKDGESITMTDIPSGYQYSVSEKEVPDDYKKVQYQINNGEASTNAPADVVLTADTTVTVINDRDLKPSDTGIDLGNIGAFAGAGAAGVALLALSGLYLRKRYVR
nr:DUF5979 domain-containing protein [uncultured Mediterraneibacter sp.]